MWINILLILCGLPIIIYFFIRRKYNYWSELGVPHEQPTFPYGNYKGVGKVQHSTELYERLYKKFKGRSPVIGLYATVAPHALVVDLDLIQQILIKDFPYFHDHGRYYNEKDDPLTAHIFSLRGQRWRAMRAKISPIFSSAKLKMMLPIVLSIADNLHRVLLKEVTSESEVNVGEYFSRFSKDVIGSAFFGLNCNCLEESNTEFEMYGGKLFHTTRWVVIKENFATAFPTLARLLRITIIDKEVSNFFRNIVSETIKFREETGVQRNDFLNQLMHTKTGKTKVNDEEKLSVDEIAAQAIFFFSAGFDSSSSTMSFALYEMAKNLDLQDKARRNVKDTLVKYGGKLSYEALMEMTYLDQVIYETLRKYPPAGYLSRRVTKDYQVPGMKLVLKKDIKVIMPIKAIQNDPNIYPEPDKFDPERFSPENTKDRHNCAFLSFGEGPRSCIAYKFGLMQVRIALATVLRSFIVMPSWNAPNPVIIKKNSVLVSFNGGVRFILKKVQE